MLSHYLHCFVLNFCGQVSEVRMWQWHFWDVNLDHSVRREAPRCPWRKPPAHSCRTYSLQSFDSKATPCSPSCFSRSFLHAFFSFRWLTNLLSQLFEYCHYYICMGGIGYARLWTGVSPCCLLDQLWFISFFAVGVVTCFSHGTRCRYMTVFKGTWLPIAQYEQARAAATEDERLAL